MSKRVCPRYGKVISEKKWNRHQKRCGILTKFYCTFCRKKRRIKARTEKPNVVLYTLECGHLGVAYK